MNKRKTKQDNKNIIDTSQTNAGYQENELIEVVSTFSQATGLQLGKELAKWVAVGGFMGASDAIPGYCGGTSLALLGVFKKLVLLAKSVFIPEKGITRWKAFIFMLPFAIGWIAGVYGIAKGTEFLAHKENLGLELLFFFSSFVFFSIPMFIRGEKPDIGFHPKKRKHLWLRRFIFIFGFLLVIGLASYIKFGPEKGIHFGDTEQNKNIENRIWELNVQNIFTLILVAFIGGIFTITPGGSGAIIQLLFPGDQAGYRMYQTIHWKIMANFQGGHGSNFLGLIIFALSTILGMLTMIFLFAWLFKKHKRTFAAGAFGMMIASSIALLIIPHHNLWNNISANGHVNYVAHRFGIVLAIIMAMICSLLLNFVTRYKQNALKDKKAGLEVKSMRLTFLHWIRSLFTLKYWKSKFLHLWSKLMIPFSRKFWIDVIHYNRKNVELNQEKDTIKEIDLNGEK